MAATVDPEDRAEPDAAEVLDVQAELAVQAVLVALVAQAEGLDVVDPDTVATETAMTVVMPAVQAATVAMAPVATTDHVSQVKAAQAAVVPLVDARELLETVNAANGSPVKAGLHVPHVMVSVVSGSPVKVQLAKSANGSPVRVATADHRAMANAVSGSLVRAAIVPHDLPVMVSVANGSLVRVVLPTVGRRVMEIVDRVPAAGMVTVRLRAAMDSAMSVPS